MLLRIISTKNLPEIECRKVFKNNEKESTCYNGQNLSVRKFKNEKECVCYYGLFQLKTYQKLSAEKFFKITKRRVHVTTDRN